MSNFENHVKGDTIKWILTLLAFILVGVLLTGILCGWFEKKESVPEEKEQPEIGGMELPETAEENGISLTSTVIPKAQYAAYGVSAAAETAQTVTATVKSSGAAVDLDVDWAVAWKYPSSEWATGKNVTSYVKVTPLAVSGENGRKATVECLKAFGEEVSIACSVRGDAGKKAVISVHYLQKVESTTIQFGDIVCDFSSGMTQIPFSAKNPQYLAPQGKDKLKYTLSSSTPYTVPLEITCEVDAEGCQPFSHSASLENSGDSGTIYAAFGTANSVSSFTPFDFSTMKPMTSGIPCTLYWLQMSLCRVKQARSGTSYTQYSAATLISDYNTYGTTVSARKLYNLTFTFSCSKAQMQPVTKKTTICIKELTDIQADSVSVDKTVLYY